MASYLDLDDVCAGNPLATKELIELREKVEGVEQEIDRLKSMEPLLNMYIKDCYSSGGKVSKATALATVKYVHKNGIKT